MIKQQSINLWILTINQKPQYQSKSRIESPPLPLPGASARPAEHYSLTPGRRCFDYPSLLCVAVGSLEPPWKLQKPQFHLGKTPLYQNCICLFLAFLVFSSFCSILKNKRNHGYVRPNHGGGGARGATTQKITCVVFWVHFWKPQYYLSKNMRFTSHLHFCYLLQSSILCTVHVFNWILLPFLKTSIFLN